MGDVPFWALSPSPFTIGLYLALSLYGGWKIYRIYGGFYKRWKKLVAWVDAVFMLGFVVVLLDAVWVVVCGLRFGASYPDSVLQLMACLFRDCGIVALCYFFAKRYLQERAQSKTFVLFLGNVVFMVVWFALAPSPAYTDWTFAIRYDYPFETMLTSFLTSHVLGKSLSSLLYLSYL